MVQSLEILWSLRRILEHNIFTTSSMHTDRLENGGRYYSCESHSNLEAVRVLAEYGRV